MFFLILLFAFQNKGLGQSLSLSRNLAKISDDHCLVFYQNTSDQTIFYHENGPTEGYSRFRIYKSSEFDKAQTNGTTSAYFSLTLKYMIDKHDKRYDFKYKLKHVNEYSYFETKCKTTDDVKRVALSKCGCKTFQNATSSAWNVFDKEVYYCMPECY